jgi:hypothetical protein
MTTRPSVAQLMFKLTRRQFKWQQGFWNAPRLLMYLKLFGGEKAKAAFFAKTGVELETFVKFGFAVGAILAQNCKISKNIDLSVVGIDSTTRNLCWPLLSATLAQSAKKTTVFYKHFRDENYAPSILREKPCIDFGSYLVAPLVECIQSRISDGIYYDVVQDGAARNEFGKCFEQHVRQVLERKLGDYFVEGEFTYGSPIKHSPDIFVLKDGIVELVIEVKSKRLNSDARFDNEPLKNQEDDFKDIAKGFVQLWRYADDSINNRLPERFKIQEDTKFVLVCLDQWIGPESALDNTFQNICNSLADNAKISRDLAVRRKVSFATIMDVEYIISKSDISGFLKVVEHINSSDYRGWLMSKVFDDLFGKVAHDTQQLERVMEQLEIKLPWLKEFSKPANKSIA